VCVVSKTLMTLIGLGFDACFPPLLAIIHPTS
jgi:hypothetical protein